MQANRLVVLLISYLTSSAAQNTSEPENWFLSSSWDVLQDVLSAIGKAVDYSSTQVKNLNLDGIIGLRIVDDQYSLFLEQYESLLANGSPLQRRLLDTLNEQRWKAGNSSEAASSYDQITQFGYFFYLGNIIRKGQWAFDYPLRSLRAVQRTWPNLEASFTWNNSNTCLNNILGFSGIRIRLPPCKITDKCWQVMTFPEFTDYGLTHQLLYLEVGEMAGCGPLMSKLSRINGQDSVDTIQNYLCGKILSEAKMIQDQDYPTALQDLFLEQIFLCGILGYQEFLTKDWLSVALSLQDETGCYALNPNEKRRKREEKLLEGNCGSHKTSVALGALTTYARFLLRANMMN